MRIRPLLIASAALPIALPAIGQQWVQTQPPPANQYPGGGMGAVQPQPQPQAQPAPSTASSLFGPDSGDADQTAVEEVGTTSIQPVQPPIEYPGWARRDPWVVG